MKKIISNIIFTIYAIIAVFTTICLLSYNEFKVTEFGNYSLIIISDDEVSQEFNKGDLVIVNKADKKKINVGDDMFFYSTYKKDIEVVLANVLKKEQITNEETTYTLDGDKMVSSSYVIGPANTVKKISKVGTILSILESKWGFLFLIVLPSLIAFIYEIGTVISEIKNSKKKKD